MKRILLYAGIGLGSLWAIYLTIMGYAVFFGALVGTTAGVIDGLGILLGLIVGIPAGLFVGALSRWAFNLAMALIAVPVMLVAVLIYKIAPGRDPLVEQPQFA